MRPYTDYGIEPNIQDADLLRVFNPDTGVRSQWFSHKGYSDMFGVLHVPDWAIAQIAPPPNTLTPEHIAVLPLIVRELETTNNGKLMLARLPAHLKAYVPGLLAGGYLERATFLETGDSIRLGGAS